MTLFSSSVHHPPDLDGDVPHHRGVDPCGEHFVPTPELGVHQVGDSDEVGAGALFDAQRDRGLPIHPGPAGLILETEDHLGHIADEDGMRRP